MGFILYIIASLLWLPLTLLNWIAVVYKHGLTNNYFLQTAIDIDKFGNRNFRTLLNLCLIRKDSYQFGNVQETISSVLGKNQRDKSLTVTGKFICFILDSFDKKHCKNSIKEL